jgi:hypothetical protein
MKTLEDAVSIAKLIRDDLGKVYQPPEEGIQSVTQSVIPESYVRGTRGYIEKVVNQINGSYEYGWFDSAAVMIRRLVETLIIEAFEHHQIDIKIKNALGDFYFLEELIDRALAEPSWNLSRNTKRALPKLKKIGDLSAHSRRYNAHLKDIDKFIDEIRLVVQEFVYLSSLK